MPEIARKYDFQPDTDILSGQVDEEFNQIVEAVNARAEKDGSLQENLNADLLDGFEASETGGTDTIPVCNGVIQVNLNAEMIGGLTASDLADAGFPSGTKLVFYQAAPPAGWTAVSRPSVDRALGWGSSAPGGQSNGTGGSYSTGGPFNTWAQLVDHFVAAGTPHTLAITEIPAHTHTVAVHGDPGASGFPLGDSSVGVDLGPIASSSAGGGGSHTHPDSEFNNGTYAATAYRPPLSWIIIASKD